MATPAVTVDVREMLCAQALAVVAQQIGRLRPEDVAAVYYAADDVQHDLLAWANDRGYQVALIAPGTLHIQLGRR